MLFIARLWCSNWLLDRLLSRLWLLESWWRVDLECLSLCFPSLWLANLSCNWGPCFYWWLIDSPSVCLWARRCRRIVNGPFLRHGLRSWRLVNSSLLRYGLRCWRIVDSSLLRHGLRCWRVVYSPLLLHGLRCWWIVDSSLLRHGLRCWRIVYSPLLLHGLR